MLRCDAACRGRVSVDVPFTFDPFADPFAGAA
jgi:hypothetical protein